MVAVEDRLWIGFGLEWTGTWTGQIGLDWIGSRRGLRWVRFNVREDFWAPPFRMGQQQWPKIDGCDVCGKKRYSYLRIGTWAASVNQNNHRH